MSNEIDKPKVPKEVTDKWQRVVNLLAKTVGVPAALIMEMKPPQIEVFISSDSEGNPYHKGEKADLNTGLYCETVIQSRKPLLVPDATKDPDWDKNPDIDLGMIYYLGFPIEWPDKQIFGTICVLDYKDNPQATKSKDLLFEFKELVEMDLELLLARYKIDKDREKIKKSEEKYKTIVENQTEFITKFLPDTTHTFANDALCRFLNVKREYILGKKMAEMRLGATISEEDLKKLERHFASFNEKEPVKTIEHRFVFTSGEVKWVEWTDKAIFDESGKLIEFHSVGRDITERKRLEKELRNERTQILSIFESIDGAIHVCDVNTYEILYANEFAKKLFSKDLIGGFCYREIQNKDAPCEFCTNWIILQNKGKPYQREYRHPSLCKDFLITDRVIKWSDGRDVKLVMAIDITDRKEAEEKIKESENTLRGIFNSVPDGIALIQDRKIVWANEMMSEITGYSNEELLGKDTRFLYASDEDYEKGGYNFKAQLDKGKLLLEAETRFKRKDGDIIYVDEKMIVLDEEDPSKGYISTARDITDRVKLEEELIEANKKLEEIIEFFPDATLIVDNDRKVITWNKAMEDMTGVPKKEILGKDNKYTAVPFYGKPRAHLVDLVFDQNSEIKYKYKSIGQNGRAVYAEVFVPALYNNKGAYVWAKASPLLDQNGDVIGVIESIRDITDSKEAEERLKESEMKLRKILNSMPIGIKLVQNRKIIWCNESLLEMTGYGFEEISDRNLKFLYFNKEEYARVGKELYDGWAEEEERHTETVWRRKDGAPINCYLQIAPLDPLNPTKEMIEVVMNITDRIKSKKQLDDNLVYFAHLVDQIRNPLAIISGFAQIEVENEKTRERFLRQIDRIENIIKQLDQGWMDTEETRRFLRKHKR